VIEESALVVASDAEIAEVEVQRRSTCGSCTARGACGTSLLDRLLGRRPLRMVLSNAIGAAPGERVVIGVSEQALLRAALAAYLLPLLGLIVGAVAGTALASLSDATADASEWASIVGGVSGLLAALRWLQRFGARTAADPRYRAVLLRRDSAPSIQAVRVPPPH
jgi:sigma-E factor negative regulatory protein RseC